MGTVRVQWGSGYSGYGQVTVGVQSRYSGVTVGVQSGYSGDGGDGGGGGCGFGVVYWWQSAFSHLGTVGYSQGTVSVHYWRSGDESGGGGRGDGDCSGGSDNQLLHESIFALSVKSRNVQ